MHEARGGEGGAGAHHAAHGDVGCVALKDLATRLDRREGRRRAHALLPCNKEVATNISCALYIAINMLVLQQQQTRFTHYIYYIVFIYCKK